MYRIRCLAWALGVVLLAQAVPLQASSRTPAKVIAGWVEKITFTPFDVTVSAKLDTGAATSSINAQDIELFRGPDGRRWVRFTLVLKDTRDEVHRITLERPRERRVRIKEDEGHDRRPVVSLEFCFDGRPNSAQFTLNDRSAYIYPVLLGRSFLAGKAVVDPELTFQTRRDCGDLD